MASRIAAPTAQTSISAASKTDVSISPAEHAVAGALGFREQPDDADAFGVMWFLGAPLGKMSRLRGDDSRGNRTVLRSVVRSHSAGQPRKSAQSVGEVIEFEKVVGEPLHHHVENRGTATFSAIGAVSEYVGPF